MGMKIETRPQRELPYILHPRGKRQKEETLITNNNQETIKL